MSSQTSVVLPLTILSVVLCLVTALPLDTADAKRGVSCPVAGQIHHSGVGGDCAPCNSTCTDHFPWDCPLDCRSGCGCKAGQLIDEASHQCVDLDKCSGNGECKLASGEMMKNGELRKIDICQDCLCLQGSLLCNQPICEQCKSFQEAVSVKGQCCPSCVNRLTIDPVPTAVCTLRTENGFRILEEGKSGSADNRGCTTCTCRAGGRLECSSLQCRVQCQEGEELQQIPYQCCPTCVPAGHLIPVIHF